MNLFVILIILLPGCTGPADESGKDSLSCGSLNLEHLHHLYAEIKLQDSIEAGIIHIYSEAPDYEYAIEPLEGYTCVDDVARAIVFLANCGKSEEQQHMLDLMVNFLLYMQSDTGYFYNFIWHDGSINKTYRTSRAIPDWWSWRAFWALEEYAKTGQAQADRISSATEKLTDVIFKDFLHPRYNFQKIKGISLPNWLPGETAADQAAVLILALENYYNRTRDIRATQLIRKLCEGILQMQAGDDVYFPYGAFLSWQNLWHAYGNSQSYALLKAGKLLGEDKYIRQALLEIDHFYPWLIEKEYLNFFMLEKQTHSFKQIARQQFPQIAYGFRPMIFACLQAYELTGNTEYLHRAKKIGTWFAGKNAAERQMYMPETGRCYDAINSEQKINLNSGAESTIEALLSLQALEKAGILLREVYNDE